MSCSHHSLVSKWGALPGSCSQRQASTRGFQGCSKRGQEGGGGMHDVSKGQAYKLHAPFTTFHSSQPPTKLTERRLETVLQPLEEKQL